MICRSVTPPFAWWGWFHGLYDRVTLYVPRQALDAYTQHEEWGKFQNIVPFDLEPDPGDINGDGTLDVDDVTLLIGMMLNGEELPAYADLTGDSVADIDDVAALISILLNGH